MSRLRFAMEDPVYPTNDGMEEDKIRSMKITHISTYLEFWHHMLTHTPTCVQFRSQCLQTLLVARQQLIDSQTLSTSNLALPDMTDLGIKMRMIKKRSSSAADVLTLRDQFQVLLNTLYFVHLFYHPQEEFLENPSSFPHQFMESEEDMLLEYWTLLKKSSMSNTILQSSSAKIPTTLGSPSSMDILRDLQLSSAFLPPQVQDRIEYILAQICTFSSLAGSTSDHHRGHDHAAGSSISSFSSNHNSSSFSSSRSSSNGSNGSSNTLLSLRPGIHEMLRGAERQLRELPFSFVYLQHCMQVLWTSSSSDPRDKPRDEDHPEEQQHIRYALYEILDILRSIPDVARVDPQVAQERLCGLLLLIKECLVWCPTDCGLKNAGCWLHEVLQVLTRMQYWPAPMSTHVVETIAILTHERAHPGTFAQQRVLWQVRRQLLSTATGHREDDNAEQRPGVPIVLSRRDAQYHANAHLIRQVRPLSEPTHHHRTTGQRKDIQLDYIVSMIVNDWPMSHERECTLVRHLRDDSTMDQIEAWFDALVVYSAPDDSSTNEDDGDNRTLTVQRIVQSILPDVEPPDTQIQTIRMPDCTYLPLSCLTFKQQHDVSRSTTNESPLLFTTSYVVDAQDPLDLRDVYYNSPREDFCCGLMGSNALVHRFLCAYVDLQRESKDDDFASANFRLYVFPDSSGNDLANVLASRDVWYRRHVYVPFHEPLALCPVLGPTLFHDVLPQEEEEEESSSADQMISPETCRRTLMQNFFHMARVVTPFVIYECSGWTKNDGQHVNIPFMMQCHVGLLAAAQVFHERKRDTKTDAGFPDDKVALDVMLLDKRFNVECPTLVMSYQPDNDDDGLEDDLARGSTTTTPDKVETQRILHLSLASVPQSTFGLATGRFAQPERVGLELNYRTSECAKLKRFRRPKVARAFVDGLSDHQIEGRRSLFVEHESPSAAGDCEQEKDENLRVREMTLAVAHPDDPPFVVTLDHQVFGPFKKIHIAPAWGTRRHEPLTLPLMHYFPLE